jgi:hypothetical protein
MWSKWIWKKNRTYVIYIAKLGDGSKKSQENFQNNLEEGLRWKRRENGLTQEDLKLKCCSPL